MKSPGGQIIVVGASLSGLMAAVILADRGVPVLLLSSPPLGESPPLSHSFGINAAFPVSQDSWEKHAAETLAAAEGLADGPLVRHMTRDGTDLIDLMVRLGVPFHRDDEGFLKPEWTEAGRHRRTLYAGEQTAHLCHQALLAQVRRLRQSGLVEVADGWECVSFIKRNDQSIMGLTAVHRTTLEVKVLTADAVIIAGGTASCLYGSSAADDSVAAMAYQQGAAFANAEFIQIHPVALSSDHGAYLISGPEALEKARYWVLRDGKPWYFLEEFYPRLSSRVPRLVLTRAIHKVIHDLNLSAGDPPPVYWDMTHDTEASARYPLLAKFIRSRLGLDMALDPIPVTPFFAFALGGLWTDENQMTTLEGLFACGDACTHYHGANALEGNVLLAQLFNGRRAGLKAAAYRSAAPTAIIPESIMVDEVGRQNDENKQILHGRGDENAAGLQDELVQILRECVFLARDAEGLRRADEKIQEMMIRHGNIRLNDTNRRRNDELFLTRHLWHRLELARLMVRSSLAREESRGFHYRTDFPQRDDERFQKLSKGTWSILGPKVEFVDVKGD